LDPSSKANFQRLGLMALLAISGLHLALFFSALLLIFGRGTTARRLAIAGALAYVCLGGFSTPLIRSFGMLLLYGISVESRRPYSSMQALGTMAFLEWVIHPQAHLDVSFQLSYLGVLGILWGFEFPQKRFQNPCISWLFNAYRVSWGAMLWTWPIGLAVFGAIPTWSWLFAPLMFALFVVVMAYVMVMGLLSLWMTLPSALEYPIELYLHTISSMSQDFSWISSGSAGPWHFLCLYYGALVGLWWIWRGGPKEKALWD
jgi:competence protein ComEC